MVSLVDLHIFRFAFERAIDEHFLGARCQAYMSLGILRFPFTDKKIAELLPVRGIKLNVGPFDPVISRGLMSSRMILSTTTPRLIVKSRSGERFDGQQSEQPR